MKQKVCRNVPHTSEALPTATQNVILELKDGELQSVSQNLCPHGHALSYINVSFILMYLL
jgi:hypothetical protein